MFDDKRPTGIGSRPSFATAKSASQYHLTPWCWTCSRPRRYDGALGSSASSLQIECDPMPTIVGESLRSDLTRLVPGSPRYATDAVDRMLAEARAGSGRATSTSSRRPRGGGPLAARRRAPPAALAPGVGRAERRGPAQGDGRPADVSDRPAPGGADPRDPGEARDAAEHVPDAPRRKGRRAALRRLGPIPPARRPGPARRDPRGACPAARGRPRG